MYLYVKYVAKADTHWYPSTFDLIFLHNTLTIPHHQALYNVLPRLDSHTALMIQPQPQPPTPPNPDLSLPPHPTI